jgi:site-specific DNA-methyltransferase (adenine-specific)
MRLKMEVKGQFGKVIIQDCIKGLRKLNSKEFDLCLSDVPYGKNIAKNGNIGGNNLSKVTDYNIIEDSKPLTKEQFKEIQRISKNQIIFGFNYYLELLYSTSGIIVWDKKKKNNWNDNFSDCELIWTSFNRPAKVFRYLWLGAMKEKPEKRYHPTQKPLELILWILENYSKKNDKIIDPFCGSGTTAMACEILGLNYLCYEIKKDYNEIIENRILEGIKLHKKRINRKIKKLSGY